MKKFKCRTGFLFFFIILFIFSANGVPSEISENLPGKGDIIPSFSITAPLDTEDKAYLNLGNKTTFNPADLKIPFMIIEVFNIHCAACKYMRPYMNELFERIENDPELKNKIKIIGIGAGNDKWDIDAEKNLYKFPIFPDKSYEFHDLVGQPPTPFLIYAVPYSDNRLLVVGSHLGRTNNSEELFRITQAAFRTDITKIVINNSAKAVSDKSSSLQIPINEDELMLKIRQSLSINGVKVTNIKKILEHNGNTAYAGTLESGKNAFSVVVARKIPCADCHNVFFIYSFDNKGNFLKFIPISISKYGNISWNENDIQKIQNRFSGISILNKIDFDSKVDAITSATISSEIIYDSINNGKIILEMLIKKGY